MTWFGLISFLEPWALAGLITLPVIWWLLRVTPPVASHVRFPAIRILFELIQREETPARTPWWLLALRLILAALVIIALARPILNPEAELSGSGPILLVVDDGWAAAANWKNRIAHINELIERAARTERPIIFLTTAPPASGDPLQASKLMPATDARGFAAGLKPKPWNTDRRAALKVLTELKLPANGEVFWLADGIGDEATIDLAERLQWVGPVTVFKDQPVKMPKLLTQPTNEGQDLKIRLLRPEPAPAQTLWLRASGDQGRLLAREQLTFAANAVEAERVLDLPSELRNRLVRLDLEEEKTAGATVLLDERFRRRPVGIVSGGSGETNQPLLSEVYYIERALQPFAELRHGNVGDLLSREIAVLILADIGQVVGDEKIILDTWVNKGGILARFAGPKLAESTDNLIPVKLRSGGRALGGVLSWEQPAHLAPFAEASPFRGLPIPNDVVINKQILAEPALDLSQKTWARLSDETPLVTAEKRGNGWIVLFHITANTEWSSLPLSGLFVDMLRRVVELSQGIATADNQSPQALPPLSLMDGFGQLGVPGGVAQPLPLNATKSDLPNPRHPPGFYGTEEQRHALNVAQGVLKLSPLPDFPSTIALREWTTGTEIDLLHWLLAAAILLALIDLIIALALKGFLRFPKPRLAASLIFTCIVTGGFLGANSPTLAQTSDSKDAAALAASLDLRLAYILTGNGQVDATSRAGMVGLSRALQNRTSVEPAEPVAIDIEREEILFFPLLYWPITAEQANLSDRALSKIDNFIKTGGTILFDTRDQDLGGGFGTNLITPQTQTLRQMLAKLDLPPLVPVPPDHILTKAFYLMQDFPGRWANGRVWVERLAGGTNDGVSSIIIGGNDWASAWAIDDQGRPLTAVVPGGAAQREQAYRFGINLVMYTLTGNYKADQVHVPALLERLGQ